MICRFSRPQTAFCCRLFLFGSSEGKSKPTCRQVSTSPSNHTRSCQDVCLRPLGSSRNAESRIRCCRPCSSIAIWDSRTDGQISSQFRRLKLPTLLFPSITPRNVCYKISLTSTQPKSLGQISRQCRPFAGSSASRRYRNAFWTSPQRL